METQIRSGKTAEKPKSGFAKLFATAALVVVGAGILSGCYVDRGPYRYHTGYYRPRPVIVIR